MKSQSYRRSHNSILSPQFSLNAMIHQARKQQQIERRHTSKLSQSHKLIVHTNSTHHFQLPDLWHRTGNSLNLTRSQVGISDNTSKAGHLLQNSSSGKTIPKPQEEQPKTLQQLYGQKQTLLQGKEVPKRSQLERLF